MVNVEGVACLHEFRKGGTVCFPEDELNKLKSAIEAVDADIFHDTPKGEQVPLDSHIASGLDEYLSDEQTEYQLWDKFGLSVDLYNPEKHIAVEIEKTEQKWVWKNLIKFSRGMEQDTDKQVDFGCIIVPVNYPGGGNIFSHAKNALEFTSPLIPIQDVLIIGYRDPRDRYSQG